MVCLSKRYDPNIISKGVEIRMTEYCSVCGSELMPEEETDGICRNCQCSIVSNSDIEPNL